MPWKRVLESNRDLVAGPGCFLGPTFWAFWRCPLKWLSLSQQYIIGIEPLVWVRVCTRPSVLATGWPGPRACSSWSGSTRGWNFVSGATRTQTKGSIPLISRYQVWAQSSKNASGNAVCNDSCYKAFMSSPPYFSLKGTQQVSLVSNPS